MTTCCYDSSSSNFEYIRRLYQRAVSRPRLSPPFLLLSFLSITFLSITFLSITFLSITFGGRRICYSPSEISYSLYPILQANMSFLTSLFWSLAQFLYHLALTAGPPFVLRKLLLKFAMPGDLDGSGATRPMAHPLCRILSPWTARCRSTGLGRYSEAFSRPTDSTCT
jgi:hypothetical protein